MLIYKYDIVEEFKEKIDVNEFIEWEEVYEGNFYGTLKAEIERLWVEGKNVIFDVDVKGGLSLKKYFGDNQSSALKDYVLLNSPIEPKLEGRIIFK